MSLRARLLDSRSTGRAIRVLLVLSLCLVSVLASSRRADAAPQDGHGDQDAKQATLRQVAGILDYIGGDYRGAVSSDGASILDQGEYKEQKSLAEDARNLLGKVGIGTEDPLQVRLTELSGALDVHRDPATIERLCQEARTVIVNVHHADLAPTSPPSRAIGEQLYRAQACNTCHGDDGAAQTPAALALDPRPANFLDAERVATVSPHRAFHAISFGVPGTAMVAYPKLSDQERWSLAFYVLSLRHGKADLGKGRAAYESLSKGPPVDARGLSELTEEQLDKSLSALSDVTARANAAAYLRMEAPFAKAATDSSMAIAFEQLAVGLKAYRAGERVEARRAFISAYLDGVEPHEASLRARDETLVHDLEAAMLALRTAAGDGVPVAQLEAAIANVRALLSKAEHSQSDESTAFIGAFTIALREGLEIVLLVAALLGLVRKRGQPELAKYVHLGWFLAIPAGFATYFAASSALNGMQRELAEGLASLLAAVVLLGVTHWLLGQLSSKHWVKFLATRLGDAVSSGRAAWGVMSLSFLAAYREAFEIVLFMQALIRDAGSARQVMFGALSGLVLLCVVAVVLLRIGQKLKPAPFMLASSICLAALCFLLVGKGVHALQEAAVVPLTLVSLRNMPLLGIYGSVETLAAQGLLLAFLVFSVLWPRYAARRDAARLDNVAAR